MTITGKTKESQNQTQMDTYQAKGPVKLGPWTSHIYRHDPRHLTFILARYKFCAKMLAGMKNVLEVGCGDAFGLPLVAQVVESVHGIDFEPLVLEDARNRFDQEKSGGEANYHFSVFDITANPMTNKFDAAYSLDVIEHIPPEKENLFFQNINKSLTNHGVCIIGTPNIEASKYATKESEEGHINLKNDKTLRASLSLYFHNVFIFSMNDEVVHTGFYPMAHYLFGMGVGIRNV